MWNRIKTWWAAERTMEGLHRLDDRLLADAGLQREGLRAQVHGRTELPAEMTDGLPNGEQPCRA